MSSFLIRYERSIKRLGTRQQYFGCGVTFREASSEAEFNGYIPKDRIKKRFMRSGGPGGQNVNMVNTKCQIRFNLNEANWLSNEIRQIFRKRFMRFLNLHNDVCISSDKSRLQIENQKDCFERLKVMLLECNKELHSRRLPIDQDTTILESRAKRAAEERLRMKRIHSMKKRSRNLNELL